MHPLKIRFLGFSTHASPEMLDKFLEHFDGYDMALMQLNFVDWTLLDAKRQYEQWMWQAQQARALYPSLDLAQEVHNPRFMELLRSGADVGDAYLVAHRDEIIPAAMHYTAKAVEEKLANRIAANGLRPSESAMVTHGTAVVADQVSHMSKAQRQDIIRRVRRGEIIKF